jgi:hypothetical protein
MMAWSAAVGVADPVRNKISVAWHRLGVGSRTASPMAAMRVVTLM